MSSSLSGYHSNFNNPVNFFDPWGDGPGKWLTKLLNGDLNGGSLREVTVTASMPDWMRKGLRREALQRFVSDGILPAAQTVIRAKTRSDLQKLQGRFSYTWPGITLNGPVVSMDTRSPYEKSMGRRIAAERKWMHQRYETQQGQWFGVISGAAQAFTWEYVGIKVANGAKMFYSMSKVGQELNAINTGLRIATPYGIAEQSFTKLALKAREEAQQGALLYRIGIIGKSNTYEAQFWSFENPAEIKNIEAFAKRYGIPEANLKNGQVFIETGRLNGGARFITREAPGVGINGGGGIELVTDPFSVRLETFSTINF